MRKNNVSLRLAAALGVFLCVLAISVFTLAVPSAVSATAAEETGQADMEPTFEPGEEVPAAVDEQPAELPPESDGEDAPDDETPDDETPNEAPGEELDEEGLELAAVPAALAPLGAAPLASDAPTSIDGYLYMYKVAGYYGQNVSPSIYGGGTHVTIDSATPVGFEEGMQFESQGYVLNGYVRVGHKVTTPQNPYSWTCVGFIPVAGDPSYGNWVRDVYLKDYCFETVEEGEAFVREQGGVLYGEVPSAELMETLAGYGPGGGLMVIWSRVMPHLPETHYDYGDPIIDDANPVDWQPTTDGVEITAETRTEVVDSHVTNIIEYTVTIPEGMDEDVLNINLAEVSVPDMAGLQPGDDLRIRVVVQDKSGRRYTYLEGSGSIGTTINDSADPVSIGFEQYTISRPNTSHGHDVPMCVPGGWRIYNNALDELYSAVQLSHRDTPDPDDERNQLSDVRIGYALALAGYEYHPDDELVKGYAGEDDPADAWQVLRDDLGLLAQYDMTLDDVAGWLLSTEEVETLKTVLADLTQNLLDDYYLDWANDRYHAMEQPSGEGPWFTSFKDIPKNYLWDLMNGICATATPESNRSVANAIYYGFYEYYYPAASGADGEDAQGLYTIMRESVQADPADLPEGYDASLATGNGYDDELFGQWDGSADESGTTHELGWWHHIDGSANGNGTQDTVFFVSGQFKLVKPVVEVRVSKVWDDEDDKDGVRPDSVVVALFENGKASSQDDITLDESSDWSGSWTRLPRYADNEEIAYTVEEVDVPAHYEAEVTGGVDDGFVITNTYKPEPPTPDTPDKPDEPVRPNKPSVLPKTGDKGFIVAETLFLISALAIAAGVGTRILAKRKERQH